MAAALFIELAAEHGAVASAFPLRAEAVQSRSSSSLLQRPSIRSHPFDQILGAISS